MILRIIFKIFFFPIQVQENNIKEYNKFPWEGGGNSHILLTTQPINMPSGVVVVVLRYTCTTKEGGGRTNGVFETLIYYNNLIYHFMHYTSLVNIEASNETICVAKIINVA